MKTKEEIKFEEFMKYMMLISWSIFSILLIIMCGFIAYLADEKVFGFYGMIVMFLLFMVKSYFLLKKHFPKKQDKVKYLEDDKEETNNEEE